MQWFTKEFAVARLRCVNTPPHPPPGGHLHCCTSFVTPHQSIKKLKKQSSSHSCINSCINNSNGRAYASVPGKLLLYSDFIAVLSLSGLMAVRAASLYCNRDDRDEDAKETNAHQVALPPFSSSYLSLCLITGVNNQSMDFFGKNFPTN